MSLSTIPPSTPLLPYHLTSLQRPSIDPAQAIHTAHNNPVRPEIPPCGIPAPVSTKARACRVLERPYKGTGMALERRYWRELESSPLGLYILPRQHPAPHRHSSFPFLPSMSPKMKELKGRIQEGNRIFSICKFSQDILLFVVVVLLLLLFLPFIVRVLLFLLILLT